MSDLERFTEAQDGTFDTALAEIAAGAKRSHWMWFIFPQLRGLGRSPTAEYFGLDGAEEAAAYLAHPVLGPRLILCCETMLAHAGKAPQAVLGGIDAAKLRSCATLFAAVPDAPAVFDRVLDAFYDGERCARTEASLR